MRLRPSPTPGGPVAPGPHPRLVAGAVALAALVALAGCSPDSPALPRVGDNTASATAGADDLVAVAKKLHDCLADAGLPATYENDEDGRPTRVTMDESVAAIGVDAEGGSFGNNAGYLTKADQFFTSHDGTQPALEVDGVDRTETWTTCLDQSGYSLMATLNTSSNSAYAQEYSRHVVDSSNQWAACARQHGFPETKDAVMPADENSVPMALLPPSITEPQLRQLLIDCPSFDAEQAKKNADLMAQANGSDAWAGPIADGVVLPPSIGFDYPGLRGNNNDNPVGSPESPDPTGVRLFGLMTILRQAATDYYAAQGSTQVMPG